jgi:hypothetical protein
MKKFLKILLFIVAIAGLLAVLKPTDTDFQHWVREKYALKRVNAKGENFFEKLVDKGVTTTTEL